MRLIHRALLAVVTALSCTLPAIAQTATTTATSPVAQADSGGPTLIWVWVWILVAGIIIFIVGTSAGMSSGRR